MKKHYQILYEPELWLTDLFTQSDATDVVVTVKRIPEINTFYSSTMINNHWVADFDMEEDNFLILKLKHNITTLNP